MLQLQHQDYVLAPYLSTVKNFEYRRVVSTFRCGCHGLDAGTGEFKPVRQKVDREQHFCLVCASDMTEDEHHFVFDCPAHCSIRTDILPFPGDQPLPCLLSLHYMTPGTFPSFCTKVYVARGYFRRAAALVAVFYLQLSGPLC